jgi:hypothetical protein
MSNEGGIFQIFNMGFAGNPLQGSTTKGLLSLIFPNGEAMFSAFEFINTKVPSIFKKVSGVDIKPHIPAMPGQGKGLLGF